MNERSILEQICQASSEEIGNLMRGFMRECVIESFMCVVGEEVISLCGAKYHPDEGIFSRAGSAPGILTIGGLNERIIRPRVRKKTQEGSKEFNRKRYAEGRSQDMRPSFSRRDMQTPEHKTSRAVEGKDEQELGEQLPSDTDPDNSLELLTQPFASHKKPQLNG